MNRTVCLLFQGERPHPVHQSFGEAVDCAYRHFETGRPIDSTLPANDTPTPSRIRTGLGLSSEYDIIIAEGSAPLQTGLVYRAMRNRKAVLLYLGADETFYTLRNRPTRNLWRVLKPATRRLLTGGILVGERVAEWCAPYLGRFPARTVHPPILDERYNRLSALKFNSPDTPFEILSVGVRRDNKNFEALVKAVGMLSDTQDAKVNLTIVGEGHDEAPYTDAEWVELPGYVPLDDFIGLHEAASIYVQPSTADAYPVASLEAMLAGTPTVVADNVGTAHRLPTDHICAPTPESIAEVLQRFHSLSESERVSRGREHRQSVRELTETRQKVRFARAVEALSGASDA